MKLEVYTQRQFIHSDKQTCRTTSGGIDVSESFYAQLQQACTQVDDTERQNDIVRNVFYRVVEYAIADCRIAFAGLFAKVDYCIKQHHVPDSVARVIHIARKAMFPEPNRWRNGDTQCVADNVKAAALMVHWFCGKQPIPEELKLMFPKGDTQKAWGRFDDNVVRVAVSRWDDNFIWATEEVNGTEIQVCYGNDNRTLTREGKGSWDYLGKILWEGAQLNLVRVRRHPDDDIYYPELIILEPDFLVNITTIARCFETYAESPFVNLINKLQPSPNTRAIHLGNLAGEILDDTVHGRDTAIEESIGSYVGRNALKMIVCPELTTKEAFAQFVSDAKVQKENIDKLIGHDLPAALNGYDRAKVVLEPSFISEILGIQGRLDFLHDNNGDVTIIEQKSGKGDFVPYGNRAYTPDTPLPKEQHTVQALLYRALYQYEFQRYAKDIRMMLLYSRYSKGLLQIPPMPELFLRAIKMRNLIVWSEILYAKEGMEVLTTLTPERLNQKKVNGTLWKNYTRPQLEALLRPIHEASALERLYYLRFMRFIENEQLLSKMGNGEKENSGFAATWHDSLADKKSAGTICDRLTIDGYECDDTTGSGVKTITLRFTEVQSADASNFRIGDIVILYPYAQSEEPNACAQMVNRGSIADITPKHIVVRLRNSQTDIRIFQDTADGTMWAIEHDLFDSVTGSLYSAMHSFLSAPRQRRDLLLSQRMPETDESITIRGDYGQFDKLVTRARQAQELFLIIGPPGTGKTSFGLVNLLKEELLDPEANILLISFTNRAVDEICSKLVDMKRDDPQFDFLRIGSELTCGDAYRDHLLSKRVEKLDSGNAVYRLIRQTRVFCATTASLNSNISLFGIKHFSLAIIDEASQILEPYLIGLLSAHNNGDAAIKRFVLIGDHKQLPAVVQQSAEESMVTEPELNAINLTDCRLSLFERLLQQFKTAAGYDERFVYMLTKQGRMHNEIAEFPNMAFYGGKLDVVPLSHQLLPTPVSSSGNMLRDLLTSHRLLFVASPYPSVSPSAKTNNVEAEMIAAIVREIYDIVGHEQFSKYKTVGVIVPYRNQITSVRTAIDRYGIDALHDITIDTVERYQGSQRDYIVYGFTVHQPYQLNFLTSNAFEEDGMVIDRKLNVAMTRARLNLTMIGNPALLCQNHTFAKLIDFTREHGCYIDMPPEQLKN